MASSSNHKNKKKNSYSLGELQDKRLTSRHIAALMKLDDTLLENEKLKTRIDFLEKETGSCLELHEFARNAKQTLSEAEKRFNDEKNQLQDIFQTKMLESEQKTQSQLCEMLELNKENEELKTKISDLKKQLLQINGRDNEIAADEISQLKNINDELEGELIHCKAELQLVLEKVDSLENENVDSKKLLENTQFKNTSLCEENVKLQKFIDYEERNRWLADEKEEAEEEEEVQVPEDIEKDEKINKLNKKLSLYEMERQVIIQSSSDMEIEIQHLKKKLSSLNVAENVTTLRDTSSADKKLKYTRKK